MKKLVTAILFLSLLTTPVWAEEAPVVEGDGVTVRAVAVDSQFAEQDATGAVPETEKVVSRGLFVDPVIAGKATVTGIAAVNVDVCVYDGAGNLLGKARSDANGRFQIQTVRIIRERENLRVTDGENAEKTATAEQIPTELRRGYVTGHRHYLRPNDGITRAEAAMMLARIESGDTTIRGKKTTGYKDASYGWYTEAIDRVSRKGFMRGYKDNTFKPNRGMTRAEFASVLVRLAPGENRKTHPFTDSGHHWASDAIGKAYNRGWIKGYKDGQFHPNRYVTRAEAVAMFNRALGRKTTAQSFRETVHMERMTSFIDVRPDHWAYFDVLDGANTHRVKEKSNKNDVDQWIEVVK
ncbi:MAG: S-layer homology domain-containing protein [Peptoniphilus sp.]|nr:S-layer homology domain-containing protein [Peptoniphilus sp.]MDY3118388.1 S-layer homology domain-containing protein [Peptoniphilus sp.]